MNSLFVQFVAKNLTFVSFVSFVDQKINFVVAKNRFLLRNNDLLSLACPFDCKQLATSNILG